MRARSCSNFSSVEVKLSHDLILQGLSMTGGFGTLKHFPIPAMFSIPRWTICIRPQIVCKSVFSAAGRLLSIPDRHRVKEVPGGWRRSQEVRYTRHSKTSLMEAINMMPSIAAVCREGGLSQTLGSDRDHSIVKVIVCGGAERFCLLLVLGRLFDTRTHTGCLWLRSHLAKNIHQDFSEPKDTSHVFFLANNRKPKLFILQLLLLIPRWHFLLHLSLW